MLDRADFGEFNGLSGLPLFNPVPFLGPLGNVVSVKSMQLNFCFFRNANTCAHITKPHAYFCKILPGYVVPYCCVCVDKSTFSFS